MALQPTKPARKTRLFAVPKPDYSDFKGPADGDYVRYVEMLMAWSEQEHERQRLRALGAAASASQAPDGWGRSTSGVGSVSAVQSGGVDSAVERLKRKAQMQAAKLQKAAVDKSAMTGNVSSTRSKKTKGLQPHALIFIVALAVSIIFEPDLLPVVIIMWVVFNVIRTIRAASGAGKS